MNKNMIKDSLIGTAMLDLNQVAAVGGYMDTNLPVISDGSAPWLPAHCHPMGRR